MRRSISVRMDTYVLLYALKEVVKADSWDSFLRELAFTKIEKNFEEAIIDVEQYIAYFSLLSLLTQSGTLASGGES